MSVKNFLKTFYLLFFISSNCIAQKYLLSSFPAEKDLSSKQITCFFQDSKGFMWIGTQDGLNFYNANSIKIFKHDVKNKNSIHDNYVQNICEDKNGNIWIALANGVDIFSVTENKFQHYTADDEGTPFGFKSKVYTDKKGNVFVGGTYLFKLDAATDQFKKIVNTYHSILDSRLENIVSGFLNDSKGRYWVSTRDGLFLYNKDKKIFTRFDVPPDDEGYKRSGILFFNVYEDAHYNLFAGTWGRGIFKILPDEKKLIPVKGGATVSISYSSQQLNNNEVFWCAGNGLTGVTENNIVTHLATDNNSFSPRADNISALFTDRQDQLWIGYEQSGIQILNPGNQLIKTYELKTQTNSIGELSAFYKTNSAFYVGGSYADALCKLDTNFKIQKWWKYISPDKSRSSCDVGDIYLAKDKTFWLTTSTGLINFNEQTNNTVLYKYDSSKNYNLFSRILPEGDSVLWIVGQNNGLSRFSLNSHRLELVNSDRSFFWDIVFDKNGNIWCAENNGSLQKFNRQTKNFTVYNYDTLTERSSYYDLVYDSLENNIWVAGSSGLLKVNLRNLRGTLFTEKNGLANTRTNLLCFDYKHRLWIGTASGLSMYSFKLNSFKNYYTNNGLVKEKIENCMKICSDGKLYIGSSNNLMVMNINEIDTSTQISPVYITAVYENENLLQPEIKNYKKIIDLDYSQNALSFEFAIVDYINPEDNQLFYRLQGWDKNFIQTKNGKVNYNKLPPGKYTFIVKGINHNGIRNDKGDEITIIIHPPFWQMWWFIVLISAIILLMIIFAVRYISQRNLKEKLLRLEKEQAVEKERNRISRDMHDDLGSGLTKIAIMSEVVKKQIHEPEKAKQQLENISASSRELVDNLQDIIWILNPKNDTLESLAAYIREYTLKFFEPFKTEIYFNYPDVFNNIKLSEETRRNVFLAVKETLNNIVKHAWCNTVKINIHLSEKFIEFVITDDGKGFDINEVRQFANGLKNIKERIEQINGEYKITSKKGMGTETRIKIPV